LKRNNNWHYLQLGSAKPQQSGTPKMTKTITGGHGLAELMSGLFKFSQPFMDHNITTNNDSVIPLPNPKAK
jgi:hypothetical protein